MNQQSLSLKYFVAIRMLLGSSYNSKTKILQTDYIFLRLQLKIVDWPTRVVAVTPSRGNMNNKMASDEETQWFPLTTVTLLFNYIHLQKQYIRRFPTSNWYWRLTRQEFYNLTFYATAQAPPLTFQWNRFPKLMTANLYSVLDLLEYTPKSTSLRILLTLMRCF